MNETTAGNPPSAVSLMFRHHVYLTILGLLLTIIGIVVGIGNWNHAAEIPASTPQTYALWLTPQAQIVPREGLLDLAHPNTLVSMEEFKAEVGNSPYVVTYWAGWQNYREPHWSENIDPSIYAFQPFEVYYLAKKPVTDFYLIAREKIPSACGKYYSCATVFDGTSVFSTVAGERNDKDLYAGRITAIMLFLFGSVMLGAAFRFRDSPF